MPPQPDNTGEGVFGPPTDVPFVQLWKALVDKIKNPRRYLGADVIDVKSEDHDGYVYREMGLANGAVMKEKIYANEELGRVEYRVVDADMIVVNQYHKDRKCIEYCIENRNGKKLGWWEGSDWRAKGMAAIKGQYAIAATL